MRSGRHARHQGGGVGGVVRLRRGLCSMPRAVSENILVLPTQASQHVCIDSLFKRRSLQAPVLQSPRMPASIGALLAGRILDRGQIPICGFLMPLRLNPFNMIKCPASTSLRPKWSCLRVEARFRSPADHHDRCAWWSRNANAPDNRHAGCAWA